MKHKAATTNREYKCDSCAFTSDFVGTLWEHIFAQHIGKNQENKKEDGPKTVKDALLNLLAEQNIDLMEEAIQLKRDVHGAFKKLAEDIDTNMKEMQDEADRKDAAINETLKALATKQQVDSFENQTKSAFMALFNQISEFNKHHTSCSNQTQEPNSLPTPPPPASSSSKPTQQLPTVNPKHKWRKTNYLNQLKVLMIADSIGRNVQLNRLERATNVRIKTAKAYSAVNNKSARWPNMNVTDVTKKEVVENLHGVEYEIVLLSAPTVDITNLDTSKLKPSDNTDFFKQEVIISCRNMMTVAENTLKQKPGLKKVILMCHPPRHDQAAVDPLSLKPALVKLSNTTLYQLWLDSPHKDKIFIGEHRLECSDSTQLFRYTDERTGKYDGLHFYGSSGKKAYTESVLSVLKKALSTKTEKRPSSPSSPPSPPTPPPTASTASAQDNEFHSFCPQAQYTKCQTNYQQYHTSVKDSNRFRVFNTNQGNM